MSVVTTRSGKAALVQAALEPHSAQVLAKLAELAAAGDPRSLDLFLRYAVGPAEELCVIPGLASAKTLQERAQAVLAAVAGGSCSPSAADKLLRALDVFVRAGEVDEIKERLARLEGRSVLPENDIR